VATLRMALGAIAVGGVLLAQRGSLPRSMRSWAHAAVAGSLMNAAPYSLFAVGEVHTSSILAGIWNATAPLMTVLTAWVLLPDEKPDRRILLGVSVSFAGVLTVLGPWAGLGQVSLAGNGACLGAAACYAVGTPYTRRYLARRNEPVLSLATAQLICATVEVAVLAPWFGTLPIQPLAESVAGVAALGVLGTGLAAVLNYHIVREAGATARASVTFLIPIVSTAAGLVLLKEPISWNQPVGVVLILGGLAVARLPSSRSRRADQRKLPAIPGGAARSCPCRDSARRT
jgi:drug/metabolite transporter (DMT)-like permease